MQESKYVRLVFKQEGKLFADKKTEKTSDYNGGTVTSNKNIITDPENVGQRTKFSQASHVSYYEILHKLLPK